MSQPQSHPAVARALARLIDAADAMLTEALVRDVRAVTAREYAIARRNYSQVTAAVHNHRTP